MPTQFRLEKAFRRLGIHVERQGEVVTVRRLGDTAGLSARILLPAAFPLEEKAVRQLLDFAAVAVPGRPGHVCAACATPDFHPGSIAPVGSVVATTPDFVIPAAIGTDINCGMRLITTGIPLARAQLHEPALVAALSRCLLENGRDLPVRASGFQALFDAGPAAWLDTLPDAGLWRGVDRDRLHAELAAAIGLATFGGGARHAPPALLPAGREIVRDPCLGTVGSGNHFVELQVVDRIDDRRLAYAQGLRAGDVVVMIHSGSRDVGFYVGQRWMDRTKAAWPAGLRHPESGLYALTGELATEYLQAMGVAARYAWANRVALAELVRAAFEQVLGAGDSRLVADVPHNVVLQEHGLNVHRKGATPAQDGALALIPGSMGDYSHLVTGLGAADWLWSCSHGAGRRLRRQAARAQTPAAGEPGLPWHCVTLREERRIEEAPGAYKPVGPVIDAQAAAGLIRPGVRLRPWLTFKA